MKFRISNLLLLILIAFILHQIQELYKFKYDSKKLIIKAQQNSQKKNYKILIPLPEIGFDPTEASVPWFELAQNPDFQVIFATESGQISEGCDPYLIGQNFINSMFFGPSSTTLQKYEMMVQSQEYLNPKKFQDINVDDFDGIIVVGGHHPQMGDYINSPALQKIFRSFYQNHKTLGTICHGSLIVPNSLILNKKSQIKLTSVPKYLEKIANIATSYLIGMNNYFPQTGYQLSTTQNQYTQEVIEKNSEKTYIQFIQGPLEFFSALFPTSQNSLIGGFLVESKNIVSARYWADSYLFVRRFMAKVSEEQQH